MDIFKTMVNSAHNSALNRKVYGDGSSKTTMRNISQKLKEEVLELDEAFSEGFISNIEEFRNIDIPDYETFVEMFEKFIKNSQGDELADIVIVCMAASKELNINLQKHIEAKLKYNELRS